MGSPVDSFLLHINSASVKYRSYRNRSLVLKMRLEEPDQVSYCSQQNEEGSPTTSSINSDVTISVLSNNTPNAWETEDEEHKEELQWKNNGTNQENWPLGRLEEYKALHSSIWWMMFDIGIDLQDVLFKCAGKGFKTF